MKKSSIIFLSFLCCFSCNKKENEQDTMPTEVSFEYDAKMVTYGVVKKVYEKDSKGNKLSKPITKYWLDRNLGADRAGITMNDSLAAGDLFQWGRAADGHQKRNSLTTDVAATTTNPQSDKFILTNYGGDWVHPSDNSLWNGTENKNCSCPEGWRVPTAEELGMEFQSWDTISLSGGFNSPLKWVGNGVRDGSGSIYYSYYWGFVWSSTPSTDSTARMLQIISSTTVDVGAGPKAWGYAVRCIHD